MKQELLILVLAISRVSDSQRTYVQTNFDHKEVLKLKPSESGAQDLSRHVEASANVAMWDPMWPEKHRPDQHAVFGLALNYGDRHFHWFVGSLRKVGFKGDIVLALSPTIGKDLRHFLQTQRTIAYPLYVKCKNFRDTVFQSDPFVFLEKQIQNGSPTELWLSGEHMPYKRIRNCVFNTGWIRDCYGRAEGERWGAFPVICSGSIFGTKRGMEIFETRLLQEVSKKRCHQHFVESDQGYTNILYHSGELQKAGVHAQLDPRGVGPVNTIGAFGGKRHGYYNGVDILKELRDDEGYVINCPRDISEIFKSCSKDAKPGSPCLTDQDASENFRGCDDTSRSPVVHQWDRHAHILGRFIEARISCKAGNWYVQLSQL